MINEESIYRLIFENSNQGMFLRQDDKIILVNQSFAGMVGYEIDEILGFSRDEALNMVHPEDRAGVWARYQALKAGGALPKRQVYRFLRRSGETGWWSMTQSRVEYDGRPAVLGIFEDITEQKEAQDAVARGRKLLADTLDVLPVGVCLTDETGHYRMMNAAYCAIYEYERGEMLGKHYSVIMPPDQIALANAHYARLLSGDVGIPVERKRQRKDGSIVYIEAANALVAGENGQKMVITTVRDITERKRGEVIVQLRIKLMEFSTGHTYHELMRKALDEIGELTGSPIGFYHFCDEDEHTLSLQAWSTRTQEEFCQAEGVQQHYPIDQAGVWADCVHQRKLVIHNDYASLPHRKGLPAGHAEVVRELVVPTIREERVVAILGIGNKASDYTEQDAEFVTQIADLIWSIVEQKQADEKIRMLNTRLERLAMVDELTSLPNRRAFFMQGAKEISSALRHNTPLSLLILDLDGFKQVNDTFGHDAGDFVLQRFSQLVSGVVREIDMAARMGGDEFSVLLPKTELMHAVEVAERIRAAVEQEEFLVQGQRVRLSVSIGVAAYGMNATSLEAIIKRADDSLYRAKKQARNRVAYQE